MKRKNNNNTEIEVKENVEVSETATDVVESEKTPEKKKKFTTWIISGIALFCALIIIALGIILPFALSDEYTDEEGVHPYAVMKLSNGMTITYEIWEESCPIAATNFIYLANIGYFDGTVIYDTQGGWVRFGGWMANNSAGVAVHRGDSDTAFLNKITLSKGVDSNGNEKDFSNNKFGYRIKQDTAYGTNYEPGYLTFCYERSATEFQIATTTATTPTIANDNNSYGGWKSATFGMVADQESLNNIKAIAALTVDTDGAKFKHSYYVAPLDKNGLIKIESVEVRKKNRDKWTNFDFVDYYYNSSDAATRRTNWLTTLKKTGAK